MPPGFRWNYNTYMPAARGIVNTFGVYQAYYETAILASRTSSDISWIGTFQGFLLFLVGILTGPIFDRGYFRTLISVGTFLVVFGMMMTSLGKEYYQIFLSQGLCVGLGAGCLFVPSVAICATYFSTKRALATGITAAGGSIGRILSEFSRSLLIDYGDRWRYISHRLPSAPVLCRVWLGYSCHRLHRTRNPLYKSSSHEDAAATA